MRDNEEISRGQVYEKYTIDTRIEQDDYSCFGGKSMICGWIFMVIDYQSHLHWTDLDQL